ncbi:MAG: hypothetical protein REI96_20615 [Flavobacterium nitrogenifigens]|uniref:hypothetical protein n=1 Tax=Flavobacterium nitrogenifigens TaxID=1617283 RepID=UPI0028093687|nr:hypothetical protein [Flavobacterium nitrogenifigens]MDQ8014863.1 hypothetical protein [Flavobacterium nitrogenifigens]
MVIKRVIIFLFISIPIINSICLSYIYMEVFMLNKYSSGILTNMGIIILTQIFSLILLGLVNVFIKQYEKGNLKINFRSIFVEKFTTKTVLFFFVFFFFRFIYHNLKTSSNISIATNIPIFIEIICLSFAINKIREKAILKIFGYLVFWNYLGIMCFCVTGFFIQYLGCEKLDSNDLKLVFIGVFYHLLNACFLFYSSLPKNMI